MRLSATRLSAVRHGSQRTLEQQIAAIYRDTEGVWYDPSDITRYMATGPELVVNGDFNNGVSGWSQGDAASLLSVTDGVLRITNNDGTAAHATQNAIGSVIGKTYRVALQIVSKTFVNGLRLLFGGYDSGTTLPIGMHVMYITASNTSGLVVSNGYGGVLGEYSAVDNISVKELTAISTATMFQDAAGTIPVTAVEQPVGLILDKSGNGNHASQTVSTRRPVLSARKNWLLGTDVLATQNVTVRATPQVLSFHGTGTVTLSGTATGSLAGTGANDRASLTFTPTAGTLTLTVSGSVTKAQLKDATVSAYQAVRTSTDYDIAGHPIFLKFDAVDDSLSTPSIDFTSTDKMTVVAGVRKLSDAATGVLAELSNDLNNNLGSFYCIAPNGALSNMAYASKGTLSSGVTNAFGLISPTTRVFTALSNISQPLARVRIDGNLATTNTQTQGTGTYGNYPLFIGARAGTSLFFNGHINSLTIFGKTLTPSQLATVERYTGRKTGITL